MDDFYLQQFLPACILTLSGLIFAYQGRKILTKSRQLFGFLCGLFIFFLIQKTQIATFQKDIPLWGKAAIAIAFGILGVISVHLLSFLLTMALGVLLGSTVYFILVSLPYVYENIVQFPWLRHILMAVLVLLSILFLHFCEYLAQVTATCVVGAFLAIFGSDIVIQSGISQVVLDGIVESTSFKPNAWIYAQISLLLGTTVVGALHQLTQF